jgi:hypothetical protein
MLPSSEAQAARRRLPGNDVNLGLAGMHVEFGKSQRPHQILKVIYVHLFR